MNKFDLDTPLLQFGNSGGDLNWTLRNAVEGVQIFGGIGSGKTSSSGKTLAYNYLSSGFGGLVLTVKPDEKEMWEESCRITGRMKDLMVIEPGGKYGFDFLQYLSTTGNGSAITDNILETLKTVIEASDERENSKSSDPFWEKALDMLIFNVLDLCALAYNKSSVQLLYDIVQSLPKYNDVGNQGDDGGKPKAFDKAFLKAKDVVKQEINHWYNKILNAEQRFAFLDGELYEAALLDALPNARLLKVLDQFFFETFKNLSGKTRSVIEFSFSGFLFRLLRDPIYSIFCRNKLNVRPEDSINGKIILLNLPVKTYHKVGRDCQILFKYLWQMAMEKRNIKDNDRPVFLYADESQHFIHENDSITQATARSSRIATVYITQNLPNYYAAMGGTNSDDRIKSFLGTLATKIFHANASIETNKYASELIGDSFFIDPSRSITTAEKFSQNDSIGLKLDRRVRPEEFIGLKTGGKRNNFKVEAYIHVQGDKLFNNENFRKVKFDQNYK